MRRITVSGLLLLLLACAAHPYSPPPLGPNESLVPVLVSAKLAESRVGVREGLSLHVYDTGTTCPTDSALPVEAYLGFLSIPLDDGAVSISVVAGHRLFLRFYFDMISASIAGRCDVGAWFMPRAGSDYEVSYSLSGPSCEIVARTGGDRDGTAVPLYSRCF